MSLLNGIEFSTNTPPFQIYHYSSNTLNFTKNNKGEEEKAISLLKMWKRHITLPIWEHHMKKQKLGREYQLLIEEKLEFNPAIKIDYLSPEKVGVKMKLVVKYKTQASDK